jgi:hypothetical protein
MLFPINLCLPPILLERAQWKSYSENYPVQDILPNSGEETKAFLWIPAERVLMAFSKLIGLKSLRFCPH